MEVLGIMQGFLSCTRRWAVAVAALVPLVLPVAARADMLSSSPPSSNYNAQPYFFGSQTNNFQISNSGAATMLGAVTITGPDAARFSLNGEFCSGVTLADGQSCNVGVNFNPPNGPGTFNAKVEIPSDVGIPNPLLIPLSAQALAGPAYSASPTRIDFPATLLGTTSSRQLTITNTGDFQGGVQQAFIVGPRDFEIGDDLCTQVALNPGQSCTMSARFVPSAVREFQGAIFAVVNSPVQPVLPINLSGAGRFSSPPEVRITRRPPKKSRSRTVSFQFTSSTADVRFECALDNEGFAPCTSPVTYLAKRGKHRFKVRAKDEGGNVGTPTTASWKVTKKKKAKNSG